MLRKSAGILLGAVPPGTVAGYWVVLFEEPRRYGLRYLRCRCVCGVERGVTIGALRTGESKSCGCQKTRSTRKHGLSATGQYGVWQAMIQRCHNPRNTSFKNYGGRGIAVCQRWRDSYAAFITDMGNRPEGGTLDRIDNDGNYEPSNCRWASRQQQNNNTRWTHERRVKLGRINAIKRWHPDRRSDSA